MNVKEAILTFRNDLSQLLREATIPLSEHVKGERGLSDRERASYGERVVVLKLIVELWDAAFACKITDDAETLLERLR